jgi:hypothetical protein
LTANKIAAFVAAFVAAFACCFIVAAGMEPAAMSGLLRFLDWSDHAFFEWGMFCVKLCPLRQPETR